MEEAANGAREDKYMACTRFSKVGRGERRGEGTKEKERFGKERAGKRGGGGGHTGRRDVLDGEGTQRRKLNGEERARERESVDERNG